MIEGDRYRPFLDGLRAVAVYLVVAFHAGSDRFAGGYVGVDVFFVLSGYLVTQLLLRDLAGGGSISFRRFYSRRFRRLLPAAFAMLVVTALAFSALASPVEVAEAEDGFRASFLYVANWHLISESADYFGADPSANPMLHFWSLAVEEQFYLLWPLLLGGLALLARRAGSRQWHVLRGMVLVGALASLLWAWSMKSSDPSRAYYGTDTRAYQLLFGALLAFVPGLGSRRRRHTRLARITGLVALGAVVVVSSSWSHLDPIERGLSVSVITVVLIAAMETADGGLARGVLSTPTIVYLGKISYGTYLWHWPVILVMARSFDLSTLTTIALAAMVATALASLSYQLLEQPIRLSPLLDRYRTAVIAGGLAISVTAAVVIIPTITDRSSRASVAAAPEPTGTGFTPIPGGLDFAAIGSDIASPSDCRGEPARACTLREGSGLHILLMGDSHAQMVIPTFLAVAEDEDLTLSASVHFVCPWQRGLYAVTLRDPAQRLAECRTAKEDLYDRVIPELDPDVIVVVNRGYEEPGQEGQYLGPDEEPLVEGDPGFDAWIEERTTSSLAELKTGDRSVVVLEPVPYGDLNQLTCLSEAEVVEACREVVDPDPSPVEQLYRRLDRQDDRLWSLDIDRLVCPYLPVCDPIVDGQVVRTDWSHLTRPFARSLGPAVGTYLADNGIVAR